VVLQRSAVRGCGVLAVGFPASGQALICDVGRSGRLVERGVIPTD
jgi:hypothetical protein